jgi:hypothetical protein
VHPIDAQEMSRAEAVRLPDMARLPDMMHMP